MSAIASFKADFFIVDDSQGGKELLLLDLGGHRSGDGNVIPTNVRFFRTCEALHELTGLAVAVTCRTQTMHAMGLLKDIVTDPGSHFAFLSWDEALEFEPETKTILLVVDEAKLDEIFSLELAAKNKHPNLLVVNSSLLLRQSSYDKLLLQLLHQETGMHAASTNIWSRAFSPNTDTEASLQEIIPDCDAGFVFRDGNIELGTGGLAVKYFPDKGELFAYCNSLIAGATGEESEHHLIQPFYSSKLGRAFIVAYYDGNTVSAKVVCAHWITAKEGADPKIRAGEANSILTPLEAAEIAMLEEVLPTYNNFLRRILTYDKAQWPTIFVGSETPLTREVESNFASYHGFNALTQDPIGDSLQSIWFRGIAINVAERYLSMSVRFGIAQNVMLLESASTLVEKAFFNFPNKEKFADLAFILHRKLGMLYFKSKIYIFDNADDEKLQQDFAMSRHTLLDSMFFMYIMSASNAVKQRLRTLLLQLSKQEYSEALETSMKSFDDSLLEFHREVNGFVAAVVSGKVRVDGTIPKTLTYMADTIRQEQTMSGCASPPGSVVGFDGKTKYFPRLSFS